jgi:hypothetical protein
MDEYDRWYRGYQFRLRLIRDGKLIAIGVVVTLATLGAIALVSAVADYLS